MRISINYYKLRLCENQFLFSKDFHAVAKSRFILESAFMLINI